VGLPAGRPRPGNQHPAAGTGAIALGPRESLPGDASTDDEQASISFPEGAVVRRGDETSVAVRIAPVDPATVSPAPRGLRFDGNAYRIVAVYAASGSQAALAKRTTVVLRYPAHATVMLRSVGGRWTALPTARLQDTVPKSADIWDLSPDVSRTVLLTVRVPASHRQMVPTTRWCVGSQAEPRSVEIPEPVPARIGPRGARPSVRSKRRFPPRDLPPERPHMLPPIPRG